MTHVQFLNVGLIIEFFTPAIVSTRDKWFQLWICFESKQYFCFWFLVCACLFVPISDWRNGNVICTQILGMNTQFFVSTFAPVACMHALIISIAFNMQTVEFVHFAPTAALKIITNELFIGRNMCNTNENDLNWAFSIPSIYLFFFHSSLHFWFEFVASKKEQNRPTNRQPFSSHFT